MIRRHIDGIVLGVVLVAALVWSFAQTSAHTTSRPDVVKVVHAVCTRDPDPDSCTRSVLGSGRR